LQRRGVHVTLADTEVERVALLPGLAVLLLLPLTRRLVARRLADHPELAQLAEPKAIGHLGDLVDARATRRLVEEAVAGIGEAALHGETAMAALQPAMELDVAQLDEAIARQHRPRIDRLGLECGQRGHHLVGRAWRIDAADRLVVQWSLGIVEQVPPFG